MTSESKKISELFLKTMDLFLARGHKGIEGGVACEQVADVTVHVLGCDATISIGGTPYRGKKFSAVYVRRGIVVADVGPAGGVALPGAETDLIVTIDAALAEQAAA